MDGYCNHQKIYYNEKSEYYFFTWTVPSVFYVHNLNISSVNFKIANGCCYNANLNISKDEIAFKIRSCTKLLRCFVSMVIGSETLLSNTLRESTGNDGSQYIAPKNYYYELININSEDKIFQKLKQHQNDSLIFICKIIYSANDFSSASVKTLNAISTDAFYNLKPLAATLKHCSEPISMEKVLLQVGEDTETVSKVLLCARSPVFAKMFENDMKELKDNIVVITDIKMPVIKVLVSFMYTGQLLISDSDLQPNGKFDFLCDLYYASDKYNVAELRQLCVDLFIPLISMENINRVIKLAYSHNDVFLKSTVLALISTNIKTWFTTSNWKQLVDEQPKIAAEVLTFYEF